MRCILFLAILVCFLCVQAQQLSDYQKAYGESFTFEASGNYKKALSALQDVHARYPKDYELNLRMGWLSYLSEDYKNSAGYLKKAMEIKENALEPITMILLPLTAQRNWKTLEYYGQIALQKAPLDYYANIRMAYAYYLQQSYPKALARYTILYTHYPSDISVKLGLASTYMGMKQYGYAAYYYGEILKVYPNHAAANQGYAAATRK